MSFLHWFIDPIKNHYLDFSGRATRQEYWMFFLVYIIFVVVVAVIDGLAGMTLLGWIFTLAIALPYFALGARRLHDTGLSGWWQLINVVPILGAVILIILFARKSQPGMNKYGTNLVGM